MRHVVFLVGIVLLGGLWGARGAVAQAGERPVVADTLTPDAVVAIDRIDIEGNDRTRARIILRELGFEEGKRVRLADLDRQLQRDREKILNTGLFNAANLRIEALPGERVRVKIRVRERWYIFPAPIFNIADRNFSDWWVNQGGDLSRVNYGLKVRVNNMRGLNETLRLTAQLGFVKKLKLKYDFRYLDRAQRQGLAVNLGYVEYGSLAYRTDAHEQLFLTTGERNQQQYYATIGYSYRPSFYTSHGLTLGLQHFRVSDTVAVRNPAYLGKGRTRLAHLFISYDFNRDKRDLKAYALRGYQLVLGATQRGLGLSGSLEQLELHASYARFLDLSNGFFVANYARGYLSLADEQPYVTMSGLGFGKNYVRGYDLYVIEGPAYVLNKTTLKKRLFAFEAPMRQLPLEQFQRIPVAFYLKAFFDAGYVRSFRSGGPQGPFSDRWIYGTGLGLDVVTYYDTVLRFEYAFARDGEHGFFFSFEKEF